MIKQLAKDCQIDYLGMLRDLSLTKASRWAPVRRIMPDGSHYSIEDYPYIAEILDSEADQNFIQKGAQTGLTEALITEAYFVAVQQRQNVLYYFPEVKQAKQFSATRFDEAIQCSPSIAAACRKQSVDMKQFDGATIYVKGATRKELKSTSASRLFLDELDEWTKENIYLAEQRLRGQRNKDTRFWGISTPSYPDMGIDLFYQKSTQERFYFDCPHCNEEIRLDFHEDSCTDPEGEGNFVVRGENPEDEDVFESYLKCNCCHEKLNSNTKSDWLKTGRWKPTNPNADPKLCRGFHVSQLYSPAVEPYEIAKDFLRGQYDEQAKREFYNSVLGLPYAGSTYRVSDVHINACQMDRYHLSDPDTVAPTAKGTMVTLGIDQGGPYHTWVAVDWKLSTERVGDCNDRAVGKIIGAGKILHDDWDQIHGLMRSYHVRQCVIDHFPEPTNARVFARNFIGYVHLCQYVTGVGGRELRTTEDEYGADQVKVDKVSWLTKTLGRIHGQAIRIPIDLPDDFREHIKTLTQTHVERPDGTIVAKYQNFGKDDHFAHALNYAEIALRILDPAFSPEVTIKSYR